jgi:hypothetical protein
LKLARAFIHEKPVLVITAIEGILGAATHQVQIIVTVKIRIEKQNTGDRALVSSIPGLIFCGSEAAIPFLQIQH